MQFTIIARKSSVVKRFFQKNKLFSDLWKVNKKIHHLPSQKDNRARFVWHFPVCFEKWRGIFAFFSYIFNISAEIMFTNRKKYDILL